MTDLPPECPCTIEHALLHVNNIKNDIQYLQKDLKQLSHDADIAHTILSELSKG